MHSEVVSSNPGDCPKCKMTLVKKEVVVKPAVQSVPKAETKTKSEAQTIYTCPMHPEVISEKAGKCPKCGMELVEKENHKHAVVENPKGEKSV